LLLKPVTTDLFEKGIAIPPSNLTEKGFDIAHPSAIAELAAKILAKLKIFNFCISILCINIHS